MSTPALMLLCMALVLTVAGTALRVALDSAPDSAPGRAPDSAQHTAPDSAPGIVLDTVPRTAPRTASDAAQSNTKDTPPGRNTKDNTGSFTAYWNVPVETCSNKKVYFDLDRFEIVHNTGDSFMGDKMNIFYSAGEFPTLPPPKLNNGGIPQLGNLSLHVEAFAAKLEAALPAGYAGPVVLDFEVYLPSYDISLPKPYKTASLAYMQRLHPTYDEDQLEAEARRTFDESSKSFFQSLLDEGTSRRPDSLVGYYHYPYCHNYHEPYNQCTDQMMELNDELVPWLFNASTALFPSIYTFKDNMTSVKRVQTVNAKLGETQRVNRQYGLPMLPYFWYRFHDDPSYLPGPVVLSLLWLIRANAGQGVVIWGASADLDTYDECYSLQGYLNSTLGPLMKCMHDLPDAVVGSLTAEYPTNYYPAPDSNQTGEGNDEGNIKSFNKNSLSSIVSERNMELTLKFLDDYCLEHSF